MVTTETGGIFFTQRVDNAIYSGLTVEDITLQSTLVLCGNDLLRDTIISIDACDLRWDINLIEYVVEWLSDAANTTFDLSERAVKVLSVFNTKTKN